MHQNSPFSAQKSKNFLGRPIPQWGGGNPLLTLHPPRRLRRLDLAPSALATRCLYFAPPLQKILAAPMAHTHIQFHSIHQSCQTRRTDGTGTRMSVIFRAPVSSSDAIKVCAFQSQRDLRGPLARQKHTKSERNRTIRGDFEMPNWGRPTSWI